MKYIDKWKIKETHTEVILVLKEDKTIPYIEKVFKNDFEAIKSNLTDNKNIKVTVHYTGEWIILFTNKYNISSLLDDSINLNVIYVSEKTRLLYKVVLKSSINDTLQISVMGKLADNVKFTVKDMKQVTFDTFESDKKPYLSEEISGINEDLEDIMQITNRKYGRVIRFLNIHNSHQSVDENYDLSILDIKHGTEFYEFFAPTGTRNNFDIHIPHGLYANKVIMPKIDLANVHHIMGPFGDYAMVKIMDFTHCYNDFDCIRKIDLRLLHDYSYLLAIPEHATKFLASILKCEENSNYLGYYKGEKDLERLKAKLLLLKKLQEDTINVVTI